MKLSFIEENISMLKERGEKALVVYLTAGDPDIETSLQYFLCAATSGADILEVGIPFSDPMADGSVIQRAFNRSLMSGTNMKKVFWLVGEIRKVVPTPIVLFGYLNPVLAFGPERFFRECSKLGVDGALLVDMPFDESLYMRAIAKKHGVDWIGLVAPTTGVKRTRQIAKSSSGFVYVISVTGITGTRKAIPKGYIKSVRYVRKEVELPVVVGFGISSPDMAAEMARHSDGVVVGSACVRIVEEGKAGDEGVIRRLSQFIEETKMRLVNATV